MLNKLKYLPLASVLAFATPVFANSETVTFTGTSTSFCTITKGSDGTLALNTAGTSLSTSNTGGAQATFTVASNAASTLDLDDALTVVDEPSGFVAVRTQSIVVTNAANGASLYNGNGGTGATAAINGINANGTMNLAITRTGTTALPAGSYSYSKTITCTPDA